MAVDFKYGKVTTEHGTIGEDEPVVVFRAQDRLLPEVLAIYHALCELAGSPDHHLMAVSRSLDRVQAWQAVHHTRTPNSNDWAERAGTT